MAEHENYITSAFLLDIAFKSLQCKLETFLELKHKMVHLLLRRRCVNVSVLIPSPGPELPPSTKNENRALTDDELSLPVVGSNSHVHRASGFL